MYLAPLNYDRFFERVFKHVHIAKKFLEDFLSVEIEEIELLPRKNKITDDSAFVEFDFRCKIKGKYVIIDMQQWYKQDVVKRFYLYFCNNTSLQLERIKIVNTPKFKKKAKTIKNYEDLEPAITIVWMADDTLGFEDDIIAFTMLPEIFKTFINDDALWENLNPEELRTYRKKILSIVNNDNKNLSFLAKNRLIFALQPCIIKNHLKGKNKTLDKFIPWFLFAQKTRNKDNKPEDFETFKKEPIFMEVIELLKTSDFNHDDWQYVTDEAAYEEGLKGYNEKILREAGFDMKRITEEKVRLEQEIKKVEKKKVQAEQEVIQVEQEKMQVEQEKMQVEQEKMQVEKTLLKSIKFFLNKGFSFNEIASELEFNEDTLKHYLSLISENENE
jgi:hypothetical protein